MYHYKARVIKVYDGDSITVLIQLGFKATLEQNIRILGIDTPEIRTKNLKEKKFGLKVRDYLKRLIEGKEVFVKTEKPGKFGGRYLAQISILGRGNVGKILISKGYARPYHGEKKKPWVL